MCDSLSVLFINANLILAVVKMILSDCLWYFFLNLAGGDQSSEGSTGWTTRGNPKAAAFSSVSLRQSQFAACHYYFLDDVLLFYLPVAARGVPSGFPWRRNGPQRCALVTTGDQPAFDRSHATGGRGGSLEEDVSGIWAKSLGAPGRRLSVQVVGLA